MKISIYAPYAKERFETARQHSILHPEQIVGNSYLGISSCLSVIWAKLRWAVPEISGHAQVKRDLKLDVDGPL